MYLSEEEIEAFFEQTRNCNRVGQYKTAGYYFLLSCFTGFRISDAHRFDYSEWVTKDAIVMQAKKNKNVVSVPIHPQLRNVLDYIKDHPLDLSEDKLRKYTKEICKWAGIYKDVTFHSGRHSWAMMLTNKGLSIEEVAKALGDSVDVARIYARITPLHLHRRITEVMA